MTHRPVPADSHEHRDGRPLPFSTMCVLRIYLKRGDQYGEDGWLRRMFKRPMAIHLVQQALNQGVTHASVHHANHGFTRGANSVSADMTDTPVSTLPVCLELVAPKPLLEQFVHEQANLLSGATLVMLEGVHVAPRLADVADTALPQVEHIKSMGFGDRIELPST